MWALGVAAVVVVLILVQARERDIHRRDLAKVHQDAADERRALEDRLIALTSPSALTQVKAVEDQEPGRLSYVDQEPGTDTIQRGRISYGDEA